MRWARVGAAMGSVLLASCTLFFADDLENGASQSDIDDGLPDVSRRGAVAASDAATADAALDAARGDAGPTRFCDRDATFCEDFDTPDGALGASWSTVQQGGATFSFDEVAFSTSPRSLRADAPVGPGLRRARLEKQFPGVFRHLRCEFALRVDRTSGQGPFPFNVLLENPTLAEYGLFFNTTPTDSYLQEYARLPDGGTYAKNSFTGTSLVGVTWRRIVLDVALPTETASGSFSLSIDGLVIFKDRALGLAYVPLSGVRVMVGHSYDANPDVSELHLDDIACELSP